MACARLADVRIAQVMVYGALHSKAVPNRGARRTYLRRQSVRDGKRVRTRTLANLTALPDTQIETIRRALKGATLVPAEGAFECALAAARSCRGLAHSHGSARHRGADGRHALAHARCH